MKILMIGATGEFAGLVLPELKRRGAIVRALIHNPKSEKPARDRGADEIAMGDLADTRSLIAAAQGVDSVFHINPAFVPDEARFGINMVHAAVAAGAKKIVFSGVLHPSYLELSNHAAKLPVEQAIYISGLAYTVLQPTIFMQGTVPPAAWPQIVQHRQFAMPYSKEKKAAYVDYRDVAEAAALALTSDRLDYGTFELCAPGMLTHRNRSADDRGRRRPNSGSRCAVRPVGAARADSRRSAPRCTPPAVRRIRRARALRRQWPRAQGYSRPRTALVPAISR